MTPTCLSKLMKPVTLCYHNVKTKPIFAQNGKDRWLKVPSSHQSSDLNIMISTRKHMIMILVRRSK